ncbi:helix-turn-helix domain-containing protein [Enterococcus gilvus]|uniref:winged helix-turn-helix domain-containing protein n=1 Tax=Enterococcus gilvus TaxID=160453 RepID=UPI003D6A9436
MKIILFTENVLLEDNLQEKFQQLGHEVLVTKSLINNFSLLTSLEFDFCLISNTVPKEKASKLISFFRKQGTKIGLKGELNGEMDISNFIFFCENSILLFDTDSLGSLNKKLNDLLDQNKDSSRLVKDDLSKNEKKVMDLLVRNLEEPLSRKEICLSIWPDGVNNSNMSQLSMIVKRINKKLLRDPENNIFIDTVWGKGYCCTQLN